MEPRRHALYNLVPNYPDRMIFRNPGPGAAGTLAVDEVHAQVIVTYNGGSDTKTYNSTRITYEMSGTINSPKLVYEHGVIITDWGTVNLTTDEQTLIANDNIYIPIVNGPSSSKSAIGAESIAIKPYEYLDTLPNSGAVNVTLDTDYPDVWRELLKDYITPGPVSVSNQTNKIYITTDAPQYLKLPYQTASGSLHAGMISCSVEDPDGVSVGVGGGGAGNITEDTSNIYVSSGDDAVLGLSMTNDGDRTIAMEFMRLTWTPDLGEYVSLIKLNTVPVTASSSIHRDSGMWIALTDDGTPPARLIDPGETINVDFDFGGAKPDMHDKYVTIECLFSP